MEEKVLVNLFSFKGIKGKIQFFYEWNPHNNRKIKIFLINETNADIIIENLSFKISNHNLILTECFIEDIFILNSGNIFTNEKDLSKYNNNEKDEIRKIIEEIKKIPLYIKTIDFENYIDNERKIEISDYKIFEKDSEDNWIEKNT